MGRRPSGAKRRDLVRAIGAEHGWRCLYCAKPLRNLGRNGTVAPDTATIEHVIPLSRGGTSRRENLRLACPRCNERRMDRPVREEIAVLGALGIPVHVRLGLAS